MEKYLNKCLDSLLIPELDAIEVLVVNDGSKDRSSEIAHEYESRYPNSFKVIDKENGNYGSCINTAIQVAKGRYAKILDADDYYNTLALRQFISYLPNITSDAIFTDFVTVNMNNEIVSKSCLSKLDFNEELSYTFADHKEKLYNYPFYMHQITYKTSFLRDIKFRQTEGISYTDNQWVILPLSSCNTFSFIFIELYQYLLGREGQTMSLQEYSNKYVNHLQIIVNDSLKYYSEQKYLPNRDFFIQKIAGLQYIIYKKKILRSNNQNSEEIKNQDNFLKKNYPEIFNFLGQIKYSQKGNLKLISDFRKKNYPLKYSLPLFYRLKNLFINKVLHH